MFAQTTSAKLLARVAEGADPAAWREFCDRYGELIRSFARRKGVQEADCDDLLQDVLISLTKALPGFTYDPSRGKFRSYLKTIVLRSIFRKSRQKGAEVDLEGIEDLTRAASTDPEVDDFWEAEWRQHHVRLAMRTLSAEFNSADQAAFQAYAVEGQDAAAVAQRLGLSVAAVYQAKSRMVKRLSELIAGQVAEEG
ncbi:MAG: hypothetical protein AMXMBFR47_39230 [Planctomycetota bacterium]